MPINEETHTLEGNSTGTSYAIPEIPYPSVWSIIRNHMDHFVSQALEQANSHLTYNNKVISQFKQQLTQLLSSPLQGVKTGHPAGNSNHSITREVDTAVTGAVEQVMHDLNMSEAAGNDSLFFKETLVRNLDLEIEMDVLSKVVNNATTMVQSTEKDTDFFHKMPIKDETMFVALMCMGIIVPIIFITLLVIFLRRRKENKERRQEMLLREQPEMSMDEYTSTGRKHEEEDVPDLDLKNLRV